MIARLVDAGVIVAAGHTNGTCRAVRAELAAGITGFTYLFNVISPLTSRARGRAGGLEGRRARRLPASAGVGRRLITERAAGEGGKGTFRFPAGTAQTTCTASGSASGASQKA